MKALGFFVESCLNESIMSVATSEVFEILTIQIALPDSVYKLQI